jgi:hypothetical protein
MDHRLWTIVIGVLTAFAFLAPGNDQQIKGSNNEGDSTSQAEETK